MTLPKYAMAQASFPEMYERELVGALFRPFAERTLDKLALRPDARVLDIACGTGVVARLAREGLGQASQIVGIDISPDMLAIARQMEPSVDWREGDASALPVPDHERFDAVVCQQGLQFVADKPAGAAEIYRVTAPDGRVAISTWRSDEENPFFRELRLVGERHLGPIMDQRYSFGDDDALGQLMIGAGFREVAVSQVKLSIRMDNGPTLVRMNAMALVGMSAGGMGMEEQERRELVDRIANESAPVLQDYGQGSSVVFDLVTNLATARR